MRVTVILLALASLSACDQKPNKAESRPITATPAALSFDRSGARDAAAQRAHGARLSNVLDCNGCHGKDFQGANVTKDDPEFGDMNAPNLTLLIAGYSDAEFERAVRRGVPKDGREMWFMPSESFQFLSDSDLAALLAHLRTFKPAGKQMPPIRKGPKFNDDVAAGKFGNAPEMIRRFASAPPSDLGERHAFGRRIAQQVCAGCHNSALQGYPDFTPDLDIAGAYTNAELETLLTTGKGKAKPNLGLMSEMGREKFVHFTPRERSAVIAYVKARAERPQ